MKKIILIDDSNEHLMLEKDELEKMIHDMNENIELEDRCLYFTGIDKILDDEGNILDINALQIEEYLRAEMRSTVNQIAKLVELIINAVNGTRHGDRVELLLDCCLDENIEGPEEYDIRLVKHILNIPELSDYIHDGRFIITLTSRAIIPELERKIQELPDESRKAIEYSYRPMKKDNQNKYVFHRKESAYPRYYIQYRISRETPTTKFINQLLKGDYLGRSGTAYENHFGLVFARLFK